MADYILGTESQFHYTTDGSGSGSWVRLGLTQDGVMTEDSEAREQRGVGDHRPIAIREGLIRVFGNARFIIQNIAFLEQALRSSGRLSDLAFRGGQPHNTTEYAVHTYAKIDSLTIECAAGGEVLATIDYKGLNGSFNASALPSLNPSSNKAFMWYNTSISGLSNIGVERSGGAALQPVSFNLRIENNTDWLPVISNAEGRRAKYIREGIQRVTLGMRILTPDNDNILADSLGYISSVNLNLTNGSQSVTVALSDLLPGAFERPLRPEDLGAHGITFAVRSVTIT